VRPWHVREEMVIAHVRRLQGCQRLLQFCPRVVRTASGIGHVVRASVVPPDVACVENRMRGNGARHEDAYS